ncbi:hypothetical protein BRN32_05590 [Xanthomonas oryzae pv. oryzae]|nr:hypothetical protein BRN32_05590 [Xanthomonas oryzae pv. oryzae]
MRRNSGRGFQPSRQSDASPAYGFFDAERHCAVKKTPVAFKMPAVSKSVRPARVWPPNATLPSQLDCHAGLRTWLRLIARSLPHCP